MWYRVCLLISLLLGLLITGGQSKAQDLPDLVVTQVRLSPTQPYAGDQVRFSALVINQGNAPTPAGTVIGGIFLVDGQNVAYTDTYNQSLAPGESVELVANGGGPLGNGLWIAQEGEHTVGFLVDDVNRVQESNEGNNLYENPNPLVITERVGPDLVIERLDWESPHKGRLSGKKLRFVALVSNKGNRDIEGAIDLQVAFSVDGTYQFQVHRRLDGLRTGGSIRMVSPGWKAQRGEHEVKAIVDTSDTVNEIREDNNSSQISFGVDLRYNLRAKESDAFVDSIGVNTHLSYYDTPYGDFGLVKSLLTQAGIRYIRDGLPSPDNSDVIGKLNSLAESGVRSNLITNPRRSVSDAISVATRLTTSLASLEGPNEPDIFYQDLYPNGIRSYQNDLYAAVKANLVLSSLPVLSPSPVFRPEALGSVACDAASVHPYAGGQLPDAGFERWWQIASIVCPHKPLWVTEIGYNNAVNAAYGQPGVSERAGAKYISRTYLDTFRAGVERTFVYELIDEFEDPNGQNPEARFGLVRRDGTPKPAYYTLQRMIALFTDRGAAFSPGSLGFNLSGDITNLRYLLLQKKEGTFYLIMWLNARSYDLAAKQDVDVPAQKVTIDLKHRVGEVRAYLPVESAEASWEKSNIRFITVNVPDEPLVLEISR